MGRILKYILIVAGALVALLVVAAALFMALFDPNDFRDDVAAAVQERTGRELLIEGDLDVSLFPWLAIEMGKTQLGNAPGFGNEPFLGFDRARLSVKVLPLLLRREISVGSAELDSLSLNLQVKRDGTTNWQDLAESGDAEQTADEDGGAPATLDIASISVTNANLRYDDASAGARYLLSNLNIRTGAVTPGKPVDLDAGFDFRLQPEETTGNVEISTTVDFDPDAATVRFTGLAIDGTVEGEPPMSFDFEAPDILVNTAESTADVGTMRVSVFDLDIAANVDAFSYADTPQPVATIEIDAFSPRSLMQRLDIDVPATADPNALGKLILSAKAAVSPRNIRLTDIDIVLDDTKLTGTLTVPRNDRDFYELDLAADTIDLARYMEPQAEDDVGGGADGAVPVEIPTELIRSLRARGSLTVGKATLGGMTFENAKLGINVADNQLRMHPLSATLFDGEYQGDIRINASGNVPVLSVNEQIRDVSLGSLAKAMYQRENVTGSINGTFRLEGRGNDMAEIQNTLAGNMSFVLSDGIWHGTDVWYQLRRARALFRQQTPPEPVLPAQTRFSEVSATGVVANGIMRNDDFVALLPFMRLTGRGTVNFPQATLDYQLTGRVVEKPEFKTQPTEAELKDMTRVVIPIRITGPLTAPKFGIDFAALLQERAKEEIRDRVIDRLLGGDTKEETPAEGEEPATEEEEKDPEDILKDRLKDLLRQ
ncbi:MAG: AsmA family protein [Woeseiaceae bacterium]|nr:AsmA family protein [Woeseiaceae bacterium]